MEIFKENETVEEQCITKICRLCINRTGPFFDIFKNECDLNIRSNMNKLLPFKVDQSDGLPQQICYLCTAKLTELYLFVNNGISSQEYLHNLFIHQPEPQDVIVEYDLKELKVILTRIEDSNDIEILKYKMSLETESHDESMENESILSDDKSFDDFSLSNHYTTLKLSGFGSIYTCNYCNDVLIEDQLNDHKCFKKKHKTSIDKNENIEMDDSNKITSMQKNKSKTKLKNKIDDIENIDVYNCNNKDYNTKRKELNSIYPCITEISVIQHLQRLKYNLDRMYGYNLTQNNTSNFARQ